MLNEREYIPWPKSHCSQLPELRAYRSESGWISKHGKRTRTKAKLERLTWRGLCPATPPPLLEAEYVTRNERRREGRICCEWREGGFDGGGGFWCSWQSDEEGKREKEENKRSEEKFTEEEDTVAATVTSRLGQCQRAAAAVCPS